MRSTQIDVKSGGNAMVLIPGIQGRCEWLRPTVDALERRHQEVLSFSLNTIETDRFFDGCTDHIDSLLDQIHASSAALVGISFGGLVAVHYAARRPDRVSKLVLTSPPSPRSALDPLSTRYLHKPRLALPAFALGAVPKLAPEIIASLPSWSARIKFTMGHLGRVARSPLAPRHMASWVRSWMETDLASECRSLRVSTLVVTGEAGLDRVVPVQSSLDYLRLIEGSRHMTLERTGHLGFLTRPEAYAAMVSAFVQESATGRSSTS